MDNLSKYDLHKNDFSKLHFEVNDAKPYLLKNLDHAVVPHRHSFYQIIWFKNAGRHYVDYEIINHSENTVFFINTNQIHYFCTDSINEGVLFHFNDYFISQFNPEFLERFSLSIFNEIGKPCLNLSESEIERFDVFSKFIEEEIKGNDVFMREEVYSVFTSLLFLIERLKSKETKIDFNLNLDFKLAYSFKEEVYKNKQSFYNIDFYSNLLHTNNKKLTSVVKQYLGNTPVNIITSIKILEAKRRLANGKFSIQEIAYDLGFDQPTYFTKYFKKATGITPKEFQSSIFL